MPEELPQGTTGEPAGTPEAAGSASDDAILSQIEKATTAPASPAQNGSTALDKDLLEKLKGIDPSQLPPEIRAKLEAPFLSQFTKGQQALADQQRAITEALLRRFPAEAQQQPDLRQQLLEEVKAGNFDQIDTLLQATVQQQVGPLQDQIAKNQAIAEAARLHPFVTEREQEIAEVLRSNPQLAQLAAANGYRSAPVILQGIAQSIELRDLKARLANVEAEKLAFARQAVEAQKRRAAGLPSRTSEAGSAQGGPANGGVMDLRAAMEAAARQHGMI